MDTQQLTRNVDLPLAIREILSRVVEAIPDAPALRHYATTTNGATVRQPVKTKRQGRTLSLRGLDYTPRVKYHTAKDAPKRNPLSSALSPIYQFIAQHPGCTAQQLQSRLKLRDGQLWGALRRLTIKRLIRTLPA